MSSSIIKIIVSINILIVILNALDFVTFNVDKGLPTQQKCIDVGGYLKRPSADIYVLTEVMTEAGVEELVPWIDSRDEHGYDLYDYGYEWVDVNKHMGGMGVSIIYKKSTVTINHVNKEIPGLRNIVAWIHDELTKETIVIIGLHLKATPKKLNAQQKLESDAHRAAEIYEIKGYIQQHIKETANWIIIGDLNENENNPKSFGIIPDLKKGVHGIEFQIVAHNDLDYIIGSTAYLENKRFSPYDLDDPKSAIQGYTGNHVAIGAKITSLRATRVSARSATSTRSTSAHQTSRLNYYDSNDGYYEDSSKQQQQISTTYNPYNKRFNSVLLAIIGIMILSCFACLCISAICWIFGYFTAVIAHQKPSSHDPKYCHQIDSEEPNC